MRRILSLAAVVALALAGVAGGVAPAAALAPPPPLDACLGSGAFHIGDRACAGYAPGWGAQYGPVSGIQVLTADRGKPIPLAIPGGEDVEITRQDPTTGKVTGSARGQGLVLRVSGVVKGARVTLTFTADGASNGGTGRIVQKGGSTSVLLRSRDGKEYATLVKVEPAGG